MKKDRSNINQIMFLKKKLRRKEQSNFNKQIVLLSFGKEMIEIST
jgi:hypothetical protein